MSYRRLVVKVGTTSVTTPEGEVRLGLVRSLAREIAAARAEGAEVVLVVSGAIALGARRLGLARPTEMGRLQSLSAIGQVRLVAEIGRAFEEEGLVIGQVLLAPRDFGERRQYLHARRSLLGLLAFGAVPVVNENDAVASEEIRFGDNDRLAALVAHLVHADLLLLLTDLPGVFDADPRRVEGARLIETLELAALDEVAAGGSASGMGSGGMRSKLQAAAIAVRSGLDCIIAAADTEAVIERALHGRPEPSTFLPSLEVREPARRLWILYAADVEGVLVIDDGAVRALTGSAASLLAVGVRRAEGRFAAGAVVDICDLRGGLVARGVARVGADDLGGTQGVVVHRDDLALVAPATG